MPDGVCNQFSLSVRDNVLELKRYGRGCKPRPAIQVIFFIKSIICTLSLLASGQA
jgi:hypothetical protein